MATVKTAISLIRIDEVAQALEVTRSRLLSRLNDAYSEGPAPEEVRLKQALRNKRRVQASEDW